VFGDGAVRYLDGLERLVRSKFLFTSLDHVHPERQVQAKGQTRVAAEQTALTMTRKPFG
jgi:hypothetical protein